MSNNYDIRQNIVAAFAALAVSTVCVVGTVGPVQADAGYEQVQLQRSPGNTQPIAVLRT
jgi:hypothetical protein